MPGGKCGRLEVWKSGSIVNCNTTEDRWHYYIIHLIMNQITWIGLIASVLTTLASVPQLIKICREKKAENISLMWVFILFLGLCGWIYYGILKKDMIIFISNMVAALINAGIAVSAIIYKQEKR